MMKRCEFLQLVLDFFFCHPLISVVKKSQQAKFCGVQFAGQMDFAYLAGRLDFLAMIPAIILIICAVFYRIITGLAIISGTTWLSNFAPMAAIALCSAAYFPPRYRFSVPMVALLISDIVLNLYYHFSLISPFVLSHYIAFALIGCFGFWLRDRAGLKTLLPASLASSLIFYCLTNAISWIFDPGYAKTLAGFVQAQTVGLPIYGGTTPTWMFLRNTAISDLFFTLLFVICMNLGRNTGRARAGAALPRIA